MSCFVASQAVILSVAILNDRSTLCRDSFMSNFAYANRTVSMLLGCEQARPTFHVMNTASALTMREHTNRIAEFSTCALSCRMPPHPLSAYSSCGLRTHILALLTCVHMQVQEMIQWGPPLGQPVSEWFDCTGKRGLPSCPPLPPNEQA